MHRTRYSLGSHAIPFVVITLCLMMSACGGTISGQVYVDTNQNGKIDTGEVGVPFAKLTLTHNDDVVSERYADASGTFRIPIKVRTGKVCLSTDLSYAEANIAEIQSAISATSQQQKTTKAQDSGWMSGNNTLQPEGDKEEEDTKESESPQTPTQNQTTATAATWSQGTYCRELKGSGFTVHIPVKFDYAASLTDMPKRPTVKCYSGRTCNATISYPEGCRIKPLALPDGVTVANDAKAGISFNTSTGNVSFGDAAYKSQPSSNSQQQSKAQTTTETPSLSVSSYRVISLPLLVGNEISTGTTKASLTPSATCGEQLVSLQEIPLELIKDYDLTVEQNLITDSTELVSKGQAEIEITVTNHGKASVSDVKLAITPTGAEIQTQENCKNLGSKIICSLDPIEPNNAVTITAVLTLPTVTTETKATCDAELTHTDLKQPIDAEQVEMKVKP